MPTGTPPKYLPPGSLSPAPRPVALSLTQPCRAGTYALQLAAEESNQGCPRHPAFRRAGLQNPSERWASAGHRAESQRSAWSISPSLGLFHSAKVLTNGEVKEEIPTLFYMRWLYLHYKLSAKHPELPWGSPNSLYFFAIRSFQSISRRRERYVLPRVCFTSSCPCPELLAPRGDPRGTQCLPLAQLSRRKCFMLLQSARTLTQDSAASSSHLTLFSAGSWWLQGTAFPPSALWVQS